VTEPAGPTDPAPDAIQSPAPPPLAGPAPPAVQSTRRLIGASFDLLMRSSDRMRSTSFYIGAIVLGTVGPFALASLILEVAALHRTRREYEALLSSGSGAAFAVLAFVAALGLIVSAVESALAIYPASRIFLNPDCGFGTFSNRPVNSAGIATSKLRAIVAAAETVRSRVSGTGPRESP